MVDVILLISGMYSAMRKLFYCKICVLYWIDISRMNILTLYIESRKVGWSV